MFGSLNDALKMREGYNTTYIMGKVVVNQDASDKDLIQVEAPGLYDTSLGEVPWVGSLKKSPFGISKDWGVYGSPYPGSDVALELQDGNPNYAMYHSIQRYVSPKEFDKSGLVWGFKDPKGNLLVVDLETNEIKFEAAAGVVFNISASGELTVTSKGEATLNMPVLNINADVVHKGTITSNGVNIGSDHKHLGVMSGSSTTGNPVP